MPKPVIGISPGLSILNSKKMGVVKNRKQRVKKKYSGIGLSGGRFRRKRRVGRKKRRRRGRRRRRRKQQSISGELIPW